MYQSSDCQTPLKVVTPINAWLKTNVFLYFPILFLRPLLKIYKRLTNKLAWEVRKQSLESKEISLG
jgi:hypothetical protein